ncbi:hypothetical protein DCAR_0103838 [Daucus carota subsp. sativus]|uniref:Uncharacterized protein n=1 Tax=Daucus carota subsp. sativus TaxID=79200 RepID=A0A166IBT1_DAUCS|nr:PREDICTED: uncharacterized protein LOC108223390 [Daucus carota subsp. sativus]WOG84654.1 hypothetical protein DCAR_0103838 [Daucus carota subsp. sativus]
MASKCAELVMLFLVAATFFVASNASNRKLTNGTVKWDSGFNFTAGWPWNRPPFNFTSGWRQNIPQCSGKIIVGGDQKWQFGFNYTDWAIKTGPFYLNDTLVFQYDPPSNHTFPHSVYLLPDYQSFINCDLTSATELATVTQGGANGYELVLKNWKPYYLACGERNGFHCSVGLMKFSVMPLIRYGY